MLIRRTPIPIKRSATASLKRVQLASHAVVKKVNYNAFNWHQKYPLMATHPNCSGNPLELHSTTLFEKSYRGTRLMAEPNGNNL